MLPRSRPFRLALALVLCAVAVWAALRMRHHDAMRNLRRVAISAATAAAVLLVGTVVAGGTVEPGHGEDFQSHAGVGAFGRFELDDAFVGEGIARARGRASPERERDG